jgi:hypothetical protein
MCKKHAALWWKWEVPYIKHCKWHMLPCHIPVEVTSSTYHNRKYCTFTVTSTLAYILLDIGTFQSLHRRQSVQLHHRQHILTNSVIRVSFSPLTYWTMMGTLWLNTATFWALKYHLTFSKTHLLDHLFGCISFRHCTLKWSKSPC